MALAPLNEDGDVYFLSVLRDELEGLKKRLKHEIIQKLQLIKQIKELKKGEKSKKMESVGTQTGSSMFALINMLFGIPFLSRRKLKSKPINEFVSQD